jgi:hypothetical protein
MNLNYEKVWDALNNLEMVTSKICSAREILDSAIGELERGNNEKVETLMYATNEFLEYYLKEFDEKFKVAWKETVVKLKQEEVVENTFNDFLTIYSSEQTDTISLSDDCMNNFWGSQYYPEEYNNSLHYTDEELDAMCDAAENDKVVRWQLPVEEVPDIATGETEYFITLPDDLLEAANLKEGDDVEWVDNDNGTFILRKTKK